MRSFQLPHSENTKVIAGLPITVNESVTKKPFSQWPAWAQAISLVKSSEDRGVGDTVYRTIGPAGSKAFQTWFMLLFKRSCGCANRHVKWNAEFPYD